MKKVIGLQIFPSPSVNQTLFEDQYLKNKASWDKAFEFLRTTDLENIAVGRYEIDNNETYASITKYTTKDVKDTKWEAHRKYIDLQYLITGQELIGLINIDDTFTQETYNSSKDVLFLEADGGQYHIATPESFFVFFPTDVHRPCVKVIINEIVKKLVIKIRYIG